MFTRPLFITILAIFLLSEIVDRRRWSALGVGFLGAMIVLRPGFEEVNLGAILALGSAFAGGLVAITIRVLTRTDRPDSIATYTATMMVPITLVMAAFVWRTPSLQELLCLAVMAVLAQSSNRCQARAFDAAEVSMLQPMDFVRLPIAIFIGFVTFTELPSIWSIVGGTVIFAASVYNTRRAAKPKTR